MKRISKYGVAVMALAIAVPSLSYAADCPAVTVNGDDQSIIGEAQYPEQFELTEFEKIAGCDLSFSENPDIAELNAEIGGNPAKLPPLKDRLPEEPLVVAPYDEIGTYGGILHGVSTSTESGTTDLLSVRHVQLVRYSDDQETLVPDVAKSWEWNDDYTAVTFHLRKGHKWSDGEPFTADDIAFWYNDITLNPGIYDAPRSLWMAGDKPMTVEVVDPETVTFHFSAPKPAFLGALAYDYAQPFLPKHVLSQFLVKYNPDADKLAQSLGFENGLDVIKFYYNNSDWKDVPSPLLKDSEKAAKLAHPVLPTLESHIVVKDTDEERVVVANPYFFKVDTQGQQLPYLNSIDESFITDPQVTLLKMVNGDIEYKAQNVELPEAPTLLDGREKGNYQVDIRPSGGGLPSFAFNVTDKDAEKRALFSEKDFRLAMSYAIDRSAISDTTYLGMGNPRQYVIFSPAPSFVTDDQLKYATEYDPEKAKSMLDALGFVDQDGDGYRDLPSGKKLTLNIQYSSQAMPSNLVELVAQEWKDVGVNSQLKEVTTDEYRNVQSANDLDVMYWSMNYTAPRVQADTESWLPPFSSYLGLRVGIPWGQWYSTDGAEGEEPPAWVQDFVSSVKDWQTYPLGSEKSNDLGHDLVDQWLNGFLYIGTVEAPTPIYHSNKLHNFHTPKTSGGTYGKVSIRPQQWFIADK